ncbi:MAG: TIGR01906 family membrane protein [Chloroflexi bacterium]|nr:TIGR01906 family membrane protein [Chloroflexota bacterium]
MKLHYSTPLSWLVTLLTPLFLIGLAMRIMLAPWFLTVEYNMPYFPADTYGFTKEDRLRWAPYAVTYLTNGADISYLGDLTFEDGTPLYNERELSHMRDVKLVTQGGLRAWYVSLILLALLGLWAWRGDWMREFLQGLRRGGWLVIILAAGLGGFAAVAFWQFFTFFHSLFFEGDSWLFLFSDTLIRLFPMQFWQDVFIWVGAIVLGGALALAFALKPKAN